MKRIVLIAVVGMLSAIAQAQTTTPGYLPSTGGTLTGVLNAPSINGIVNADAFAGSDIGAQITSAVSYCQGLSITCKIQVAKSGTISTPFDLPMGFSISFAPQGVYTLSTHILMDHRATSWYFNGANFKYTAADGETAFYVGKDISSVVDTSGTTVTWVSGSTFSTIDTGDQIQLYYGSTLYAYNVASVQSPTQLTLVSSAGTVTSSPMVVYMNTGTALGAYPGQQVNVHDLNVQDNSTEADTAFAIELANNVNVYDFSASLFTHGTCFSLLGSITTNVYGITCSGDGNGIAISDNSIGDFHVSSGNSNRFYGVDIVGSSLAAGTAVNIASGQGNVLNGMHIEGNDNNTVISDSSGGNDLKFVDYERNGTGSAYEIAISGNNDVLEGPSEIQSYNSSGMQFADSTTGNVLRNLQFSYTGTSAIAYTFGSSTSAVLDNVSLVYGTGVNPTNATIMGAGGLGTSQIDPLSPTGTVLISGSSSAGGSTAPATIYNNTSGAAYACQNFGSAVNSINASICGESASATAGILNFYVPVGGILTKEVTLNYNGQMGAPIFNATTGYQIGGSYGPAGQCMISSGSGTSFGNCMAAIAARKGTFTCTAAGTITVANTNYISASDVVITMHTAGGTITTPPAMKTVTSGTGFSVLCGATDTSVYNYDILN